MKPTTKVLMAALGLAVTAAALWVVFLKQDVAVSPARQKTLRERAAGGDVVLIFNSGGWGNTPLEEATDFSPVLYGIRDTLQQRGYTPVFIPFARTAHGLAGTIADIKDYLVSFKYSSQALANEVAFIMDAYPGKQVIIVGYSNGGGLSEGAMKILGDRPGLYAIVAGVPHWWQNYASGRMLVLDNGGKDRLASGNIVSIGGAVIKSPFKWLAAKIHHQPLKYALAIQIRGHEYPWASGEVGPAVVGFLNANFARR
jgi:pimeloyl-ACP methyl ester carboxylesterase